MERHVVQIDHFCLGGSRKNAVQEEVLVGVLPTGGLCICENVCVAYSLAKLPSYAALPEALPTSNASSILSLQGNLLLKSPDNFSVSPELLISKWALHTTSLKTLFFPGA